MINQARGWVNSLSIWQRVSYFLFTGWLCLLFYSYVYDAYNDVFVYLYVFCMMGSMISFTINMIWEDIVEKQKLTDRIQELEKELSESKGGT